MSEFWSEMPEPLPGLRQYAADLGMLGTAELTRHTNIDGSFRAWVLSCNGTTIMEYPEDTDKRDTARVRLCVTLRACIDEL